MSQHLSQGDVQNYLDRTAEPSGLLAADAHLADCDVCFAMVANRRQERLVGDSMLREVDSDENMDGHLTYDQLTAYVDGGIDEVEREIVSVHMAVCRECSGQIGDLQHLRTTLQLDDSRAEALAGRSEAAHLSRLWNGIRTGAFLKFAGPAFAVLLLGVVIWSVWFLDGDRPAEIVEVIDTTANEPVGNADGETGEIDLVTDGQSDVDEPLVQPEISLADGRTRIEIDDKGNLTGLNAPQFERRVKAALTARNIEISAAARELRSKSGVLMGDGQPGSPFALTTPVGKIVESDRPQFRWRPLTGAESYVVTVFDAEFNKVAESPSLRQPVWTSPTRLRRGIVYQWQVTAVKEGKEVLSPVRPAPDAKFKIIDSRFANDIVAAKRQNGNSHLLLGIVYANAGLLDEAERELQALLRQNPQSDVARRLLQKVRAAR